MDSRTISSCSSARHWTSVQQGMCIRINVYLFHLRLVDLDFMSRMFHECSIFLWQLTEEETSYNNPWDIYKLNKGSVLAMSCFKTGAEMQQKELAKRCLRGRNIGHIETHLVLPTPIQISDASAIIGQILLCCQSQTTYQTYQLQAILEALRRDQQLIQGNFSIIGSIQ